jgi:TonB family protein
MGVASSSLVNPTRTKALMVRLAPYLVEAICELTRALKDKTHSQAEISGLLFGKSQDGLLTVEALKTFKDSSGPRSDLARRERMEKAFTAAMTLANEDPEFSAYKLLGWFSLRGGGGLINSDVEFHNRHFKNTEEVALIVWREGDTQITTELYAAVEGGKLTTEDYRWSSVRLSTELRHVSQPVDLVMRVRMNDDLYMRTYGVSDGRERKDEWKKIAENAKRSLLSLLPGRGSSSEVYPENLPVPPVSGTAKRSFESRTLFRGTDPEPSSVTLPPITPPAKTTAVPGVATRITQPIPQPPTPPAATTKETESTGVVPFDFNRAPRPQAGPPEISGLPMVIPKNRPQAVKGTPWLSMALVFVVFSALTFGFMALKTAGTGDGKLSQVMRVLFPGSDLELRASSHGDSLWISWNRRNPVVAASTGAVLSVSDGPRHFDRKLDPSQVADGEVKYTPVSGDVTFQLRVNGADQSVAIGSLRVLDATAPVDSESKPPLDLSVNATPPPSDSSAGNKAGIAPANPTLNSTLSNTSSNKETPVRSQETANNKLNLPALRPPAVPAANLTPAAKQTPETAKPAPATTTAAAPPQQQQPVQTAQQQVGPLVAPAPKPVLLPRPTTSNNSVTPQTSNTAINGWDANVPENKPAAPIRQQAETAPPDSKTVDFIGPKVLLQVMPNTRNLTPGLITEVTRVEVEVRVDTSGHVSRAHLTNPNVKGQLGSAATAAAKQWTFQPATLKGQRVDSDHTIVFEFRPEGQ